MGIVAGTNFEFILQPRFRDLKRLESGRFRRYLCSAQKRSSNCHKTRFDDALEMVHLVQAED
jgi:hypothetical protein